MTNINYRLPLLEYIKSTGKIVSDTITSKELAAMLLYWDNKPYKVIPKVKIQWILHHYFKKLVKGKLVTSKNKTFTGNSFYDSREWRTLRYAALKQYGHKCLCCGKTPNDGAVLHVDHIKPRSKFPSLELDINNLQILCKDCNLGKSNKDAIDYRPKVIIRKK